LDRLAALGEMSAVVAHEIRNPVASIAAGVDYLSAKMEPDSSEAQGAAMIQSEIQRVNRILEDILFVARPFQLNFATEDLAEIIDDVIQRCQPQIQAGQVEVSTTYAPDLPALNLDRQRLEQVFTNLILNAAQAMQTSGQAPEERRLTVQTSIAATAGSVGQKNRSMKQVIITFTDTGPGISPDAQQRIFEPFFTTKARGTGLGLSVARRVVEEHKGTIKIDTQHKKGTRFIITLPSQREKTS
jgi:signal transduction histidine kinase